MNGSTSVDPATIRKVKAAVAKLKYVPNQAARTLMTHRTNTVALVASESEDRVFGDPFFAAIIRGISQGLAGSGWWMTIVMANGEAEVADAARYLIGGHTDGALFISEHGSNDLARPRSTRCSRHPISWPSAHCRRCARLAVEFLKMSR